MNPPSDRLVCVLAVLSEMGSLLAIVAKFLSFF
jgi:hypothetical protein